jgi:excinuclease ABC subunit A
MEKNEFIDIKGASENNLKNIDVKIPHRALTVITGLSGSGKSSLAFDTLYAEGQRRYVESMSAYARQFLERIPKPGVESISGICPAIAIKQKNSGRNPRSTVGTVTEIHDFLRLLYARIGDVICRECGKTVHRDSPADATSYLLKQRRASRIYITFPFSGSLFDLHGNPDSAIEGLLKQGFTRIIAGSSSNAEIIRIPNPEINIKKVLGTCSILVDRLAVSDESASRLTESLESAYSAGNGRAEVILIDDPEKLKLAFSEKFACCGISYRSPDPRLFSFNNPYGACPRCHGFGDTTEIDEELVIPDKRRTIQDSPVDPFNKPHFTKLQQKLLVFSDSKAIPVNVPWAELSPEHKKMIWKGGKGYPGIDGFFKYLNRKKYKVHVRVMLSRYRSYHRCPDCGGERLCEDARDVQVGQKRLGELNRMPVSELREFFINLAISAEKSQTGEKLVHEIKKRLDFLHETGLDYLSLERVTSTLSGGEMQRIHLAASLGSMLSGILYVLDEPSIGLHPKDQGRLIKTLERLKNLDNTLAVVEHEREIIEKADYIIDLGPGAGESGGEVIYAGDFAGFSKCRKSLTANYLTGKKQIPRPGRRRIPGKIPLTVSNAECNNLKKISLEIPSEVMVCVTGVSGSGKSTLVHDVLHGNLKRLQKNIYTEPQFCDAIEGWEQFSEVILVDQSPIGKTPRSNPATYLKIFDHIRKIFAGLPESARRGFGPSAYSFNRPGGRCESCQGSGMFSVDMQFLADVQLPCEVCKGKRYGDEILEVRYKGKNIAEVLEMTANEAMAFFGGNKAVMRGLTVLDSVGLGYLRLGQPSTNLSGGEAQRIKLASFLASKTAGRALFIFDEPTTGLHFEDIKKLLASFNKLLENRSSLVVIEHNLEVIKCADWIIDLGPGGGEKGGEIVGVGSPEDLVKVKNSATGEFIKKVL